MKEKLILRQVSTVDHIGFFNIINSKTIFISKLIQPRLCCASEFDMVPAAFSQDQYFKMLRIVVLRVDSAYINASEQKKKRKFYKSVIHVQLYKLVSSFWIEARLPNAKQREVGKQKQNFRAYLVFCVLPGSAAVSSLKWMIRDSFFTTQLFWDVGDKKALAGLITSVTVPLSQPKQTMVKG